MLDVKKQNVFESQYYDLIPGVDEKRDQIGRDESWVTAHLTALTARKKGIH